MKNLIVIVSLLVLVSCGIQKRAYQVADPVKVNNDYLTKAL